MEFFDKISTICTFTIFVLILFSFLAFAADVSLDSPNSVYLKEEFDVSIDSPLSGTYDVKIFSSDDSNEITSFIDDDGWKNAYYYLKSSFPDKKKYKIKISSSDDEESEQTICVRLRETGKTSYKEVCKKITVKQGLPSDFKNNDDNEENDNNDETDDDNDDNSNNEEDDNNVDDEENNDDNTRTVRSTQTANVNLITNNNQNSESSDNSVPVQGKIILNEENTQKNSPKAAFSYSTPKQKTAIWISIAFAIFCAAILILILFRKI